jgi:hypothetical protein
VTCASGVKKFKAARPSRLYDKLMMPLGLVNKKSHLSQRPFQFTRNKGEPFTGKSSPSMIDWIKQRTPGIGQFPRLAKAVAHNNISGRVAVYRPGHYLGDKTSGQLLIVSDVVIPFTPFTSLTNQSNGPN